MARRAKTNNSADGAQKTAPAKAGHNGIDENTFFKQLRNIEAAERRKDKAVQELRQARKEAKEAGVELGVMDAVRKLHKFSEPELGQMFNSTITYAKWLNTPVYSQMALFDPEANGGQATTESQAYERGKIAGKRGEPVERNPWPLDVPLGRAWGAGHKDGNMELAGGIGQKAPMFDETQPPAGSA